MVLLEFCKLVASGEYMRVIGITGGIGTGKSEVSRILQELGAVVISADQLGHEAYRPPTETWRRVVDAFGDNVMSSSGEIDRQRLGALVFSDPKARAILDSIVRPEISRLVSQRIQELKGEETDTIVLEAALLIEAGWDTLVDEVWVTHAPRETVVERLKARNHLSEVGIENRIAAQFPFEERAKHGQIIIENSASLKELQDRVRKLWRFRVKKVSE